MRDFLINAVLSAALVIAVLAVSAPIVIIFNWWLGLLGFG